MKQLLGKLLLLMAMVLCTVDVYSAVYVNYTISGKILRSIPDSTVIAGDTIIDNITMQPVGTPRSVQYFTRSAPAVFNTVTIKVFKKDTSGANLVYTFANLSAAQINYVADSGSFSYQMTNIERSRFNYFALVYVDGQSTSSSKTEFITNNVSPGPPIGSIMPYFGDGTDLSTIEMGGWYLCDGRTINTTNMGQLEQSELDTLKAILSRSGNPNPNNLPDLRGYFLRGADRGTGNDPSLASRGGTGNKIGSSQTADVGVHNHTGSTSGAGSHNHSYTDYFFAENNGGGTSQGANGHDFDNNPTSNYQGFTSPAGDHTHTVTINNSTGTETRPKNVYVNYIIKCRN